MTLLCKTKIKINKDNNGKNVKNYWTRISRL